MLFTKTRNTVSCLLAGIACLAIPVASYGAQPLAAVASPGALIGEVRSALGIPQMGAVVRLFGRNDRLIERAFTDEQGRFRFAGLMPDQYSVRVSQPLYVPAVRAAIPVHAGMQSLLLVRLNTLFSSISIGVPSLDDGMMTDEWKWVLRGGSATRPVLRFRDSQVAQVKTRPSRGVVLSDERGLLRLSAGQVAQGSFSSAPSDVGTGFAMARALGANTTLRFSGALAYGAQSGVPSASFRTTYVPNGLTDGPEFSVTIREMSLPGRVAYTATGSNGPSDAWMHSVTATVADHSRFGSSIKADYGLSVESVSFGGRLNVVSPYLHVGYEPRVGERVDFSYTSGKARPNLAAGTERTQDLERDLEETGAFPRLSMEQGAPRIQRGKEYEVAYSRTAGSRSFQGSVFRETIRDAAVAMVAPGSVTASADVLPDAASGNQIFNAGDQQVTGYTVAATQQFGEDLTASVVYGMVGSLALAGSGVTTGSPDELRAMIRSGRTQAATLRVAGRVPLAGTHMVASYQWAAGRRSAVYGNPYSTLALRPEAGLNIFFRQPIPTPRSMPFRLEFTADLRNLLEQGYLPLTNASGDSILLVPTPRAFRSGLSFVF